MADLGYIRPCLTLLPDSPESLDAKDTGLKAEFLKTIRPPNFVYSDISVRRKKLSQSQEFPAYLGSVTLTPPRRALAKRVTQQTLRTLKFGFTGVKMLDRVW